MIYIYKNGKRITIGTNNAVGSGRDVKLKVMACTTKSEIDAIVDPR